MESVNRILESLTQRISSEMKVSDNFLIGNNEEQITSYLYDVIESLVKTAVVGAAGYDASENGEIMW